MGRHKGQKNRLKYLDLILLLFRDITLFPGGEKKRVCPLAFASRDLGIGVNSQCVCVKSKRGLFRGKATLHVHKGF